MSLVQSKIQKRLSGPSVPPVSGSKPKQLVVLLHGRGSDGNDLISLAHEWGSFLPDAEFISPNAPLACEFYALGYEWFRLPDFSPATLYKGAMEASSALNGFLDHALEERNLTDNHLALVGFSQGTMMALHVAIRRPKKCAAIIGYSGTLPGIEHLEEDLQSKPKILLVHGTADDCVPVQGSLFAERALKAQNVPVRICLSEGLGHGIDALGLKEGLRFLQEAFEME